jgi:DNA polymerase III gamma/tau subunit
MGNLLTKYRPSTWKEMVGEPHSILDIEQAATRNDLRAFLIHGPSGVGKTTAARLIADSRKVAGPDLIELDAASRSGVGDVRQMTELTRTRGLNGAGNRCIIVDECHRLSAQAWDALLKTIEDAPDWITFVFCTTELAKVPKTVKTRCGSFLLPRLDRARLGVLLRRVVDAEGIKLTSRVASALVDKADGSPRAMLATLVTLSGDDEEAQLRALDSWAQKSTEAIDLARAMVGGKSEKVCLKMLAAIDLKNTTPEAIRQIVLRYASTTALSGNAQAIQVLAAFRQPFPPGDYPTAHLIISVSDACL